jgi:secreted PhoX family phosphatase
MRYFHPKEVSMALMLTRRGWLGKALAGGCALGFATAGWTRALQAGAVLGPSPYGPLGAPDANGIRLPAGFASRLLATSGQPVAGTSLTWHFAPDGGATFARPDGGWVYVSNAELPNGGVGALRFAGDGSVVDAYTILSGTRINCAGGPTPWGTWLSCEEYGRGRVWECDPQQPGQGVVRPAMGRFIHEAAAVDPKTGFVYLTEDDGEGRFYRFRPSRWNDLSAGVLEAAFVAPDGAVSWIRVSPRRGYRGADTTAFARGEGAWYADGVVYFCTTSDDRVWALHTASDRLEVLYDAAALGADAPLREPDNVTVHDASGDVYVAEDADDLQLVLLASAAGERIAAPFLQLVGHEGSELAGPAFSPDGSRLYFSSQRGTGGRSNSPGLTYEISGPFRRFDPTRR